LTCILVYPSCNFACTRPFGETCHHSLPSSRPEQTVQRESCFTLIVRGCLSLIVGSCLVYCGEQCWNYSIDTSMNFPINAEDVRSTVNRVSTCLCNSFTGREWYVVSPAIHEISYQRVQMISQAQSRISRIEESYSSCSISRLLFVTATVWRLWSPLLLIRL
jgi:hypothetical protein